MQELQMSPSATYPLAARSSRFIAALLDGFIIAFVMMVFLMVSGYGDLIIEFSELPPEQRADHEVASFSFSLKMLLLQAVVFVALNFTLLQRYGQTIGKRIMKIAIVNGRGTVPSLTVILGFRYFSQILMGVVPFIGGVLRLVDVLMIFSADRRCLHDHIAKTYVIDVSKPVAVQNEEGVL